jgi:hypothetical protein
LRLSASQQCFSLKKLASNTFNQADQPSEQALYRIIYEANVHYPSTSPLVVPHVRLNLLVVPFQRNNNIFLTKQISISRFSSQLNMALN